MNFRNVKRLMTSSLLAVALLAGVGASAAEAKTKGGAAANRPTQIIVYRTYSPFWYRHYSPFWDPFYYPTRRVVVDPIAYAREQGYREGKDEGEDDAERGRPANATGHKDYTKSDSLHFREAFVKGYADGYREEVAEIEAKARKRAGD